MKNLITIKSNGNQVSLIDTKDDDAKRRYFVVNGNDMMEPTDYNQARSQFVGSLNYEEVEVDQFGEPVGLQEMECKTVVVVPMRDLH